MIQKLMFRQMAKTIKSCKYELLTVSHKDYAARFVFRDISGCPFTYDLFIVLTVNRYNGIAYETRNIEYLTDYERSKLPSEFWDAYKGMRDEAARGWQELTDEVNRAEAAKKQEVA